MINVPGSRPVPLEQAARSVFTKTNQGFAIGNPTPLDPKMSGQDLLLGEEVPIQNLKVGKQYVFVSKDDLSTLHKQVYKKSTVTVKSEDYDIIDGYLINYAIVNIFPSDSDTRITQNDGLFFKKIGVQYAGKKTRKHRRVRRRRHTRRR